MKRILIAGALVAGVAIWLSDQNRRTWEAFNAGLKKSADVIKETVEANRR